MEFIYEALEEYLKNKNIENIIFEVKENKNKENGDFYTNLSFKLSSILKKSTYDIGISICNYIKPKLNGYYDVVVSKNGYINFYTTSSNYVHTLKEIQKINVEFNINNIKQIKNLEEIIYIYNRLENIINILKLDKIYVDIEKFNINYISEQLKEILDKTINIYDGIKHNKEVDDLINELNEISKLILKYEETNIIRYLSEGEIYSFIAIASNINILIKTVLNSFSNNQNKRM